VRTGTVGQITEMLEIDTSQSAVCAGIIIARSLHEVKH
jgi:hypothetical protein